MIYVVLGMHKSGTTLISQILHHSGINMGEIDDTVSYDSGNKYERHSTLLLNEDILGQESVNSIELTAPDTLSLSNEQRQKMRQIIAANEAKYNGNWGFKDPRTCLVYSLWAVELPQHKIIAIYRHPYELWQRYRPKKLISRYLKPYRAVELLDRWFEHNLNILSFLQNTKMDTLLLEYQKLMVTQDEFKRLQEFVGIQLEDRRRIDLYRHRSDGRDPVWEFALARHYLKTKQKPDDVIRQLEEYRRG